MSAAGVPKPFRGLVPAGSKRGADEPTEAQKEASQLEEKPSRSLDSLHCFGGARVLLQGLDAGTVNGRQPAPVSLGRQLLPCRPQSLLCSEPCGSFPSSPPRRRKASGPGGGADQEGACYVADSAGCAEGVHDGRPRRQHPGRPWRQHCPRLLSIICPAESGATDKGDHGAQPCDSEPGDSYLSCESLSVRGSYRHADDLPCDGDFSVDGFLKRAPQIFGKADFDSSGALGKTEVQAVLMIMGVPKEGGTEAFLEEWDKEHRPEHVGSNFTLVDFKLLLGSVAEQSGLTSAALLSMLSRLRRIFVTLDGDGNGTISMRELRAALSVASVKPGAAAQMYFILDKDGSGDVTWLEFVQSMMDLRRENMSTYRVYIANFEKIDPKQLLEQQVLNLAEAQNTVAELVPLEQMAVAYMRRLNDYQAALHRNGAAPKCTCCMRRAHALTRAVEGVEESLESLAEKAHILERDQKLHLNHLERMTLIKACLLGCAAACLTATCAVLVNEIWSIESKEFRNMLYFYATTLTFSTIVSGLELVCLYLFCLCAAFDMTVTCGVHLWPLDRERANQVAALARAALSQPHPISLRMGVNPAKGMTRTKFLISSLMFSAKRGISKFVIKSFIQRVLPRVGIKELGKSLDIGYGDALVSAFVNSVWNLVTVKWAMRELRICCIGPSASVEAITLLLQQYEGADTELPTMAKVQALRCIGVLVTKYQFFHPNLLNMLTFLEALFIEDEILETICKAEKAENGEMVRKSVSFSSFSGVHTPKTVSSGLQALKSKALSVAQSARILPRSHLEQDINQKLTPLRLDSEKLLLDSMGQMQRSHRQLIVRILLIGMIVHSSAEFICPRSCSSRSPDRVLLQQMLDKCEEGQEVRWRDFEEMQRRFRCGVTIRTDELDRVLGEVEKRTRDEVIGVVEKSTSASRVRVVGSVWSAMGGLMQFPSQFSASASICSESESVKGADFGEAMSNGKSVAGSRA